MAYRIGVQYCNSNQCCGSGIFRVPDLCGSGSGSNPCSLSTVYNKTTLNSNHKEESITYLPFSISYYSPTKSRIPGEITFLFICSFIFCWIRIRNNNSGSRLKFRIHPDPVPQHWQQQPCDRWYGWLLLHHVNIRLWKLKISLPLISYRYNLCCF